MGSWEAIWLDNIFLGNINRHKYLQFLQNDVPLLFEEVSLQTRLHMWHQHDRALLHQAVNILNHINKKYLGQQRAKGRPTYWPARSPDLTHLISSLWGYLKTRVYEQKPENPDHLAHLIAEAWRIIISEMLHTAGVPVMALLAFTNQDHQYEHNWCFHVRLYCYCYVGLLLLL